MTLNDHIANFLGITFGVVFYVSTTVIAAIALNEDVVDGFWWPIHLVKALLKSLYRALFTEWKA